MNTVKRKTRKLAPKASSGGDSSASGVKTLRKALTIMDAFAEGQPMTVAELAEAAHISRPTAHRLVQTMIESGYLAKDESAGRVSPGLAVLQLAASLLDNNRLRIETIPHLEQLARTCGERTNLGILHRERILYLAGVEKPSFPMIYSRFGKTVPIYCSSLGKAILAALPQAEVDSILAGLKFQKLTPNTISNLVDMKAELQKVREQGYALDCEEHTLGTFCTACAIVVEGRPLGAISVTSRTALHSNDHIHSVRYAAEVIAHRLAPSI